MLTNFQIIDLAKNYSLIAVCSCSKVCIAVIYLQQKMNLISKKGQVNVLSILTVLKII